MLLSFMDKLFKDSYVLITESFPYSATSETFIIDEINFLRSNPNIHLSILSISPTSIFPYHKLPLNVTAFPVCSTIFSYILFLPIIPILLVFITV